MRDYVRGLLGRAARKNGWQLAEWAGHHTPDGLQRLLNSSVWDADALRDDVRVYVGERLGPGGVLIIDDTGCAPRGAEESSGEGECRRGDRIVVCRGSRAAPDRRSAPARGSAGGRSRCPGEAGGSCRISRTRTGHGAGPRRALSRCWVCGCLTVCRGVVGPGAGPWLRPRQAGR
ncbi:transposase [Streptomyces sp. NBC_00842]